VVDFNPSAVGGIWMSGDSIEVPKVSFRAMFKQSEQLFTKKYYET